jgi:hypothetical protein
MGDTSPPGWYPDAATGGLRWWDGQQWTEHRQPVPQQALPYSPGAPAPYVSPQWVHDVAAAQARHNKRSRIIAVIAAVVLVAVVIGWYFLAQNTSSTDWYQEGYDVGYHRAGSVSAMGQDPDDACHVALLGKINLGDNPRLRRNRELRRGCLQGVQDYLKDHGPAPGLR